MHQQDKQVTQDTREGKARVVYAKSDTNQLVKASDAEVEAILSNTNIKIVMSIHGQAI